MRQGASTQWRTAAKPFRSLVEDQTGSFAAIKIALKPKEFDLLLHLARYPGQVFPAEQLMERVPTGVTMRSATRGQCGSTSVRFGRSSKMTRGERR